MSQYQSIPLTCESSVTFTQISYIPPAQGPRLRLLFLRALPGLVFLAVHGGGGRGQRVSISILAVVIVVLVVSLLLLHEAAGDARLLHLERLGCVL